MDGGIELLEYPCIVEPIAEGNELRMLGKVGEISSWRRPR